MDSLLGPGHCNTREGSGSEKGGEGEPHPRSVDHVLATDKLKCSRMGVTFFQV